MTQRNLFLFLLCPQKESQTALQGSWRGGMMTNPSRMPELGTWRGNSKELRVWVAQRRKWGEPGGSSARVCTMPKGCQECRETSALWSSAKGDKHNLPSAASSRESFPSSLVLLQVSGNNFSGLSCGLSPDTKCGANSLAFI